MTLQLIIVYIIGIATIAWIAREIFRKISCRQKSACDSCQDREGPRSKALSKTDRRPNL